MPNNDPSKTAPEKSHHVFTTEDFEIHKRMVAFMFAATSVLVAVFTVLLYWSYVDKQSKFHLSALMVVAVAGALGGFVSALRRLYDFAPIFPSGTFTFWKGKSTSYIIMYSSIPPVIGLIVAVVVYLIFAGKLIEGPLFPIFAFDPRPDQHKDDTFLNFLSNWQPKDAVDYAKAFVWAFIAGFSEKFVPDILNGLAKTAQKSDQAAKRVSQSNQTA